VIKQTKVLVLGLLILTMTAGASAQTRAQRGARAAAPNPLAALPPSDAIMYIDVKRTLNEALPALLAGDPARLAKIDSEIAQFKTETGIDARSFDRIAIGIKANTVRPGVTKGDAVVVARGSFDAKALVAAGRLTSKANYREEKYKNSTLYIFTPKAEVNIAGLVKLKPTDLAVSVLNPQTLLIGDPARVKETLDAQGNPTQNASLISMATSTPGALIGFAGNVPVGIADGINLANDEIARNVKSIQQVYGALSTSNAGLDMFAAAKTHNPDEAASLNETMIGLKQLGSFLVGQLPVNTRALAQNALENLKIEKQASEVRLSLTVPQSDIAALLQTLKNKG
jgi:hypothetical protein